VLNYFFDYLIPLNKQAIQKGFEALKNKVEPVGKR